jgi:hypothetical protein
LLAALSCAPALATGPVATILGQELSRTELEAGGDEAAQAIRFHAWVWKRVFRHYVTEHGLDARPEEIQELLAYDREFERKDRAQRARKLEELNLRLADEGLGDEERSWLEEFRRVLARMEERDAEGEREPSPDGAAYAPWIEFWKANRALYEQYGGTVALTSSGPVPFGAYEALVADYERRGLVRFDDSRLRARVFELMSQSPSIVVPPGNVDFTPYWKLPIPPSYFPDEKRDP